MSFSDPPVTYNGISTQTTIHGAGLAGGVASVSLRDAAGSELPLPWTADPARPNRFRARVAAGTPVGTYDVVVKDANGCPAGALANWSAVDGMSPARSGYGAVCGAGFLFAFGGQGSRPGDGGVSAELATPAGGGPPALNNWNNQGERLTEGRYLLGITRESAFIFLVGGQGSAGATRGVERTVM